MSNDPHKSKLASIVVATCLAVALGLGLVLSKKDTPANEGKDQFAQHDSVSDFETIFHDMEQDFTILGFGDSNTEHNWTTRGSLNWFGLVSVGFTETKGFARFISINAGRGGDTARIGYERLERDVIQHHPDLIFVTFGTNDAHRDNPKKFEKYYTLIIQELKEKTNASIIIRTPNPNINLQKDEWVASEELIEIVETTRRIAYEEKVTIVDHFKMWWNDSEQPPSYYMHDEVHPNAIGHRRFYAELQPFLPINERLYFEIMAEEELKEVNEE